MNLYKHQKDLIDKNPRYHGLWFECGTGKTLTAIKLAEKNAKRILVVCPKSLKENWWREIGGWGLKPVGISLLGLTALNDDGLGVPLPEWQVVSKEEFRRDWKKLAEENYDGLILDEAHFFAGYKSTMHKNAIKYLYATKPKTVYLLTATPYMSTPYNIMCYEKLLGRKPNFYNYKTKYFRDVRMGGRSIPVLRKNIEDEIAKTVQDLGTVVKKDDCLDLPPQVYLREDFELTAEQKKAERDLENNPLISNAIVYWTKKHQIGGGTLKDDTEILKFSSQKLDRIKEYAKEHKKFIVVCRYNAELEMLKKELPCKTEILNGGTKDRDELITRMDRSEEGVFLINSAMSEGYNLTGFNLMIFYSNGFSFKDRIQIEGRIHRIGQENKCTYIDFVIKDGIDEDVLKSLKNKQDFDIAIYERKRFPNKV